MGRYNDASWQAEGLVGAEREAARSRRMAYDHRLRRRAFDGSRCGAELRLDHQPVTVLGQRVTNIVSYFYRARDLTSRKSCCKTHSRVSFTDRSFDTFSRLVGGHSVRVAYGIAQQILAGAFITDAGCSHRMICPIRFAVSIASRP
jgi:hypothetical protein